ncbi:MULTISPECIES: HU family DNA-binding protein [unclassified Isoptericola]|uniref:HU family DNA-binding protein n=1 Tax=unclassified Isoptericola TaxID=2623355 RepID=UPI0027133BDD|nr:MULTISPECIES: HU family DNA-binding protein [unclassified Isoptericola]MDO8145757.1 HU family DNA-binding protein [Isoptericola sp. 178]MDO8149837.1 HU family DNA-binding protein [Isoptericola sp. b408]
MNKSELAAAVAERTESTPTQARRQVDAVLDSIMESVSAGERVSLLGFGTFTGAERPARTARNPRTGDTVEVPAAVVPRFRAGSGFKARVSGGDPAPATNGASTDTAKTAQGTRSDQDATSGTGKTAATDAKADTGKKNKKGKKAKKAKTAGKGKKSAKGAPKGASGKDAKKSGKSKKSKKK